MNQYADHLKIKDALQLYFSKYHFKNGGYNDRFFKIKFGTLLLPFPNIKARVSAVKFHDIHHIVTGYSALYKGEAEIGGWEIASGCGKYWVAWILNMSSFVIGILFFQRPLLKAFLAGRLAKTNLYHRTVYNEVLLCKTVGELRNEMLFQTPNKNSSKDYLVFLYWCLISLLYHIALVFFFACFIAKLF